MKRPVAVLLCAAALACGEDGLLTSRELVELTQAEQRWQARTFPNYSYQIRRLCFCAPEHVEWGTVEVRDNAVVSVRLPGDTMTIPAARLHEWPIVDSLFADIRQAAYGNSGVAGLDAEYDDAFGFPVLIDIRAPDDVSDGGVRIEARYVTPLP